MMLKESIIWVIVVVFTAGFFVSIIGPKPVREEFTRWGLPQWVRIITGLTEGIIATLLIIKMWTLLALVAASFIAAANVLIILYNQQMRRALIPFVLLYIVLISISQHL